MKYWIIIVSVREAHNNGWKPIEFMIVEIDGSRFLDRFPTSESVTDECIMAAHTFYFSLQQYSNNRVNSSLSGSWAWTNKSDRGRGRAPCTLINRRFLFTSGIIEEKACADSCCLSEVYICYSLYMYRPTLQRIWTPTPWHSRITEIYKPCVLPSNVIHLRKRLRPRATCIYPITTNSAIYVW